MRQPAVGLPLFSAARRPARNVAAHGFGIRKLGVLRDVRQRSVGYGAGNGGLALGRSTGRWGRRLVRIAARGRGCNGVRCHGELQPNADAPGCRAKRACTRDAAMQHIGSAGAFAVPLGPFCPDCGWPGDCGCRCPLSGLGASSSAPSPCPCRGWRCSPIRGTVAPAAFPAAPWCRCACCA
jgi:hypothetical protein